MKAEHDIYKYVDSIRKADPDVHVKCFKVEAESPWVSAGCSGVRGTETLNLEIIFETANESKQKGD